MHWWYFPDVFHAFNAANAGDSLIRLVQSINLGDAGMPYKTSTKNYGSMDKQVLHLTLWRGKELSGAPIDT